MKRVVLAILMVLTFAGSAAALPVPVNGLWQEFLWIDLGGGVPLVGGCAPGALFDGACGPLPPDTQFAPDPPWTFSSPDAITSIAFQIVAAGLSGTTFGVNIDGGAFVLNTPAPIAADFTSVCESPGECLADPTLWSFGSIVLPPGPHSVDLDFVSSGAGADIAFFRPVPQPATLLLLAFGVATLLWRYRRVARQTA